MRKCLLLALAAAMVLGCFSGCGKASVAEASVPETTVYEPETRTISSIVELEGKTLSINASVEIPDLTRLEKITLRFDEDAYQRAGRELALCYYPDLKEERGEDGYRGWSEITEEGLGVFFLCQGDGFDAGRCYYEYLDNDLNGQAMPGDDSGAFDRYYFTENIPNKLGMTSLEAAEKIGEELHKYSCFTFAPWSVTACNIRENPESSGYYSAWMRPCFDGNPVYGHGALQASTHFSAEGLFAFQGIMVLKETGRTPISCGMNFDAALQKFQEDFVEEVEEGAKVSVDRITVGYKALSEYDGTWTLQPVWAFECTEPRNGYTHYYTTLYKMENGALSIVDVF